MTLKTIMNLQLDIAMYLNILLVYDMYIYVAMQLVYNHFIAIIISDYFTESVYSTVQGGTKWT